MKTGLSESTKLSLEKTEKALLSDPELLLTWVMMFPKSPRELPLSTIINMPTKLFPTRELISSFIDVPLQGIKIT